MFRPADNDRYVRNAPENPKKVCSSHDYLSNILTIPKTLFHYDGKVII